MTNFKERSALAFLLSVFVIFAFAGTVSATDGAGQASVDPYAKAPKLKAKAAILMDLKTGNVLYEKNADEKREPASTTKIMTSLLAIENLKPDAEIKVTEEAYNAGGSSVGIIPGEKIKANDLLYGTLLVSGNDAATALAIGVDGSVNKFANRMNDRVKALGLTHTHFTNPHGLHDPDHYTTARDLAIITREAMKNETFRSYVSTYQYIMPRTNKSPKRFLNNTNRMLYENTLEVKVYGKKVVIKYPDALGIKTGFTDEAGNCLVSGVSRDGKELISVVLGSQGLAEYSDTIRLLEYGLHNFKEVTFHKSGDVMAERSVSDGVSDIENVRINLALADDLVAMINKNNESSYVIEMEVPNATENGALYAPIAKGDQLGTAWVKNSVTGTILTKVDLIANESYGVDIEDGDTPKSSNGAGSFSNLLLIIIIAVLAAVALVVIVIIISVFRRHRKNRMYGAKLKESVDTREVRRIKNINRRGRR